MKTLAVITAGATIGVLAYFTVPAAPEGVGIAFGLILVVFAAIGISAVITNIIPR